MLATDIRVRSSSTVYILYTAFEFINIPDAAAGWLLTVFEN